MDQNFGFYMFYPPYYMPAPAPTPVSLPPVTLPVQSFQLPSISPKPQEKKYQRTWTKSELEDVFNTAIEYSQRNSKPIETLTISDFAVISIGKRQTPEQIMMKIKEVRINGTLRPGKWSDEEDSILTLLIEQFDQQWGKIAQILNNKMHNKLNIRNSKTCKERWNNYLNPKIQRGTWSKDEDLELLKGYLQYGNKWKSITKIIPNRIEGAIKNRIKSLLHKLRQGCENDDELLCKVREICLSGEITVSGLQ